MHPDQLWALEKERQADLLRRLQYRQPQIVKARLAAPRHGLRQTVGLVLVSAGRRLIGDERAAVDLVEVR